MTHKLKTWPTFFRAVKRREKPFEIRKNDRPFAIGDILSLEEFEPCAACDGSGENRCCEGLDRTFAQWDGDDEKLNCHACHGEKGAYTGQWLIREVTFILDSEFGLKDGYVCMGLKECEPKLSTRVFEGVEG